MITVAVGILREGGKVLVCQRKKLARYGLKWEFPGGKIEDGETPHDCLKRELKEELGIDAEIGKLYHRLHYTYRDSGSFDVFYYMIDSFRGSVGNRAFEQIRWLPEHELKSIDMLEGNREIVELLARNAPSMGKPE